MSLSVSCQRLKRLRHRNEEGIQINMEDTASHETAYKLAHRADKADFSTDCYPTNLTFVQSCSAKGNETDRKGLVRNVIQGV